MTSPALEARALRKRFGTTAALDGFDLTVARGSVHGLLGPNGAGKSTAVRCLTTLARYDEGSAFVDGLDVALEGAAVRRRIGLVGQSAAVDEVLGGRENLVLFGRLSGLPKAAARSRADELLERFDLVDAATRAVSTYSGGMRRRLDIAASLLLRPAVLFLDEPTTGLDPRARNEVWRAVRDVVALGTTVLLTTQYLDEADQLADRISMLRAGRVIAEGTPEELKRRLGRDLLRVVVTEVGDLPRASAVLASIAGAEPVVDEAERSASVAVGSPTDALLKAARGLENVPLDDLGIRRPTLDEVFLTLTDTTTEVAA